MACCRSQGSAQYSIWAMFLLFGLECNKQAGETARSPRRQAGRSAPSLGISALSYWPYRSVKASLRSQVPPEALTSLSLLSMVSMQVMVGPIVKTTKRPK